MMMADICRWVGVVLRHRSISIVVEMASCGVIVCWVMISMVVATEVNQCPDGKAVDGLQEKVVLTPCPKIPCRLKKGTNQNISIEFTPDDDVSDITNNVKAKLSILSLPFMGVDGYSICGKIFMKNGEKADCPLKAGTSYVYRDAFPVHSYYPRIEAKVNWALKAGDKTLTCFEVPVRIV